MRIVKLRGWRVGMLWFVTTPAVGKPCVLAAPCFRVPDMGAPRILLPGLSGTAHPCWGAGARWWWLADKAQHVVTNLNGGAGAGTIGAHVGLHCFLNAHGGRLIAQMPQQ